MHNLDKFIAKELIATLVVFIIISIFVLLCLNFINYFKVRSSIFFIGSIIIIILFIFAFMSG